jgi:hypothetical protein
MKIIVCKPLLRHALRMSNESAVANVHPFMRTSSAPDPDASDPAPIMRREMKLLRIEMEHLRGREDEARKIKEFLVAYVEQVEHLRANRDEWQREAERLSALLAQVPHWSLFWAYCCFGASKTWRKLTGLWAAHDCRGRARELIRPSVIGATLLREKLRRWRWLEMGRRRIKLARFRRALKYQTGGRQRSPARPK